ncbi:MAG: guanylate cyclase [bacterium]
MRLFDNYLNGLDDVLSKKLNVTPQLLREQRSFNSNIQKGLESKALNLMDSASPAVIEGPKVLFTYDKQFIESKFGINPHSFNTITIGAHPDFKELLDESSYINHHCVSVFVDIKGSTRLIEKYTLLEVRLIKDSLLTLAIQVANQFGGHVHRLQGDGIFLQFVRRNQHQNDAIINALNASAILTQFVTTDLAEIMQQHNLNPLKIRVGIDFGREEDVLWSYYGIPGCNELTTTSLHTDMAAKLQSKAYDNTILIGGNVKETLDLKQDFYSIYENEVSKEKVYYVSKQFTYPFFVFNWKDFLLSLPFIGKSSNGRTLEVNEKSITIECYISDENGANQERYYPNSKSIPKGKNIFYHLKRGNSPYVKQYFEKIEWYAFNSGKEAADDNATTHDFHKDNHNKVICEAHAGYLGHHYVECRIIRDHSENERITFPIFVQ